MWSGEPEDKGLLLLLRSSNYAIIN